MKTSDSTKEISKAMAAAQAATKRASKDASNPFHKSRYADLASVWDAVCEPLSSNGLCVTQDLTTHERGLEVTTRITHSSGEWMEFGPFMMPVLDLKPQVYGSTATYARRYSLCAALNVIPEDDDGNAASFINPDQREILTLMMGDDVPLKKWFWNLIQREYQARGLETIPLGSYASVKAQLHNEKLRLSKEAKTDISPIKTYVPPKSAVA